MGRTLGRQVFLVLFALATGAQAGAPSLLIDWQAPGSCPSRAQMLEEVRRTRGDVVEVATDPDVRARISLAESGVRWSATLELTTRGGSGTRQLEADTCARAAEAAAVVVSLALADPLAAPPSAPPELVAAPVPAPPAVPWLLALGASGVGRAGLGPGVAPGAELSLGLVHPPLRFELAASTPYSARSGTSAQPGAEVWVLLAGRLAGCFDLPGAVTFDACAAFQGTWLRATPLDFDHGVSRGAFHGAVLALLGLAWRPFASLWLRLEGGAGPAVSRVRFTGTLGSDTVTLFESPVVAGTLGLGLEWHFE